jgi:CheY-like chemotaxis protein
MEPGGSPPPVRAASGTGWILVCDDTASIRLLMRINLELAGFEVLEAGDGQAALDLLDRNPDRLPAVILLDAQMAPLDGWEAVAAIRADPALAHLPVVMVTASLQQREKERSIAAGVDAFVAKPFEPEDLVDLVGDLAVSGRPTPQP